MVIFNFFGVVILVISIDINERQFDALYNGLDWFPVPDNFWKSDRGIAFLADLRDLRQKLLLAYARGLQNDISPCVD